MSVVFLLATDSIQMEHWSTLTNVDDAQGLYEGFVRLFPLLEEFDL